MVFIQKVPLLAFVAKSHKSRRMQFFLDAPAFTNAVQQKGSRMAPLSLSKNLPAEGFGGKKSVKGNRQGFLSRSITRRSDQNCKIILHFYILQFCPQLVKKSKGTFLTS